MSSSQVTRIIETRVFVIVLFFSVVSGVNPAFSPYMYVLLERLGYSAVEFGVLNILLNSVQYLISPILFFVVLYVTCGGPLLNRIASVLISLVFGSLVGYIIGSIIGSVVVAVQLEGFGVLYYPLSYLWQHVVAQTLMGFAVLAFSDMNLRWRSALRLDEFQKRRPGGVTLLAAVYVLFALLNTVAVPVLAVYASIVGSMSHVLVLVIALGVVFGMVIVGQLVVGAGLYYGKKWGWIVAVISSASSVVIDVYALVVLIVFGGFVGMPLLTLGWLVGFMISLAILLYLLSIEVRKFFGFINPSDRVQDVSMRPDPVQ